MKQKCKNCYKFKPHIHKERLNQPLAVTKPKLIFADSMSDFWDKDVKQKWRDSVYKTMKQTPQHTYFLLTKQPQNIKDKHKIPRNCWVGVSITCFKDRWRIGELINNIEGHTFASVEPILDDNASSYIYLVDWVILGCLTGTKNGFKPKKQTISEIIRTCKHCQIPLYIKNNVKWNKEIKQHPNFS